MFKQSTTIEGKSLNTIVRILDNAFIPFDPANTDYVNFKEQILIGGAELQDAEGNVITEQAAQEFVRGLP